VGTYDRRLLWFDLDLSTKPYQSLRHHGQGIRAVAYHKRYPLFASGSDDLSAIVCHGMVYKYEFCLTPCKFSMNDVIFIVHIFFFSDLLQNPTIVPLKVLRGHQRTDDFGVLDVLFHPTQPWLFTSGADATIRLYT
jgi:ribosome biogenesis protein ERB1